MIRGHDLDPAGSERLIARMIAATPKLTGAKCIGNPELFDPKSTDETIDAALERHEQAVALCWTCPALTPCSAWADSLSRFTRPAGVLAAQAPGYTPIGRPPKKAAS